MTQAGASQTSARYCLCFMVDMLCCQHKVLLLYQVNSNGNAGWLGAAAYAGCLKVAVVTFSIFAEWNRTYVCEAQAAV